MALMSPGIQQKAICPRSPFSPQPSSRPDLALLRANHDSPRQHPRVADQVAALWALDLPVSELQRETGEIERATLAAVNAAAQKYAAPGGITVLLVGDLSKIEAGVRELSLGEVVTIDAEGKPVAKK